MRRLLTRVTVIGTAILAALALGSYALAATSTRAAPATPAKLAATVPGAPPPLWLSGWRSARATAPPGPSTIHWSSPTSAATPAPCAVTRVSPRWRRRGPARQPGRLGRDRQHSGAHRDAGPGTDRAFRAGVQRRRRRQHHPTAYAARLRIYPPNQSRPTYAFWSLKGITVKGRTYLRVSPAEACIGLIGNM